MSKAHYMAPTVPASTGVVARLGAGTGSANNLGQEDTGKLVKFAGESRYDLCVAGDPIGGQIVAIEEATSGGYTIGTVNMVDTMNVTADGSEAAGTGTLAVGDYVCAGTITAKGTALAIYPKVRKSTVQLGATPADLAGAARQMALLQAGAWMVVSINAGASTAAVGDTVVIAPMAKKI
jgi:hypothetical protein